MSNPIQQLREGILAADWTKVCHGFTSLTGMSIDQPKIEPNETYLVKALMCIRDVADQTLKAASVEVSEEVSQLDSPKEAEETPSADKPEPERPQAPTTEQRVRELKEIRSGRGVPDFRVEHNQAATEKGKICKLIPVTSHKHVNTFIDSGKFAQGDKLIDAKLTAGLTPSERRPEARFVDVKCGKCGKEEQVPSALAPIRIDNNDDESKYICNDCIRRAVK